MSDNDRTGGARTASRARDVRAHERAQYATPPSLPSLPTQPEEKNRWSSNARTNGFADAREEPPAQAAPNGQPTPPIGDDEGRWLVGYRLDRISSTAFLLGFKPPVTDLLKRKRWAVMVAGEGWKIPSQYLAHVEKLLDGVGVDLIDVDGNATPGQRERERSDERAQSAAVFADIRAHRITSEQDRTAAHKAYLEARAAARAAVEAKHSDGAASEPGGPAGRRQLGEAS